MLFGDALMSTVGLPTEGAIGVTGVVSVAFRGAALSALGASSVRFASCSMPKRGGSIGVAKLDSGATACGSSAGAAVAAALVLACPQSGQNRALAGIRLPHDGQVIISVLIGYSP